MRSAIPDNGEPKNPWLVLFSVSLGLIMVVIDVTILNIALPTIADDLNASAGNIEWTLIAYTLALTGLVPFFGRVSDVIGRKKLFITGVSIFAAGSLFCAMASSIGWLIAGRIVQAFGGALITTNTLAIITDTFPAGKRGIAMGVQSILISGGAAVGPTLGGFLVTHFGWEAVFTINIPIGLIAALLAWRTLPPLQSNRTLEPIDWAGGALLLLGLTPLLLALTKGTVWGWTSLPVLVLVVGGVVFLGFFVFWELRAKYPLVDLSLFKMREFAAGQLAGMFATVSLASLSFIFPFYWQGLRGYSAQDAGLLMLPIPLAILVVAPLSGRYSDAHGARGPTSLGLTIVMIGLFLVSGITATMPVWAVLLRVLALGTGLGMFMAPNNNSVMSAVPARKRGIASGLLGTGRFMGQSLGIALSGGILASVMSGGVAGNGLPSPDTLASLSQDPVALEAFREAFMSGMSTIALVVLPLVAIGVLFSLFRGGIRYPDPDPEEAQPSKP